MTPTSFTFALPLLLYALHAALPGCGQGPKTPPPTSSPRMATTDGMEEVSTASPLSCRPARLQPALDAQAHCRPQQKRLTWKAADLPLSWHI